MNVNTILDYQKDPNEDYYKLLGCDRLSSPEQIQTEFKVRAKECHPDKQKNITESNPERFQVLLKAKNTLLDPAERKYYDSWLDSGISVSYSQFRGLKDTVKTSMHWAVPKTEAMLEVQKSPLIKEEGVGKPSAPQEDDEEDSDDDGVSYDPTPYESLGYRVPSPVDEWKSSGFVSSAKTGTGSEGATSKSSSATANNSFPTSANEGRGFKAKEGVSRQNSTDPSTAQRRKQFATRRESSIGAMVMTNKFADDDLRMKFRTYDI